MSTDYRYQFLSHLDAPKRYLTLTIDELLVAVTSLILLTASDQKIMVSVVSFGLVSCLRAGKKGAGPKALLVLAYWYLPHSLTRFFLPQLPASHHRVWVA